MNAALPSSFYEVMKTGAKIFHDQNHPGNLEVAMRRHYCLALMNAHYLINYVVFIVAISDKCIQMVTMFVQRLFCYEMLNMKKVKFIHYTKFYFMYFVRHA